jgi:mannose-1-phosphate guanylyltransferase/phosphomannomutase
MENFGLKAAILAGGAGTRLYPITAYVPKSLIPLGSRYVIEYIIGYLRHHGVTELVMLISGKESELLRNHLGDGGRFGVKVEYSVADRIGTAGALGAAATFLGDNFIVYYGDVLTDMDLTAMIRFHGERSSVCTIAMSRAVPMDYGVATVDVDGRVTFFEEKPVLKEYPVSMGIYVCSRDILPYCKRNTDLSQDVIPKLLQDSKPVFAYVTEKRHYDIGTFKNLEEVRTLIEKSRAPFEFS